MTTHHITLDNSFLSIRDHDYLSELIYEFLADKEIFPQCIEDFKITIEYSQEDNDNA